MPGDDAPWRKIFRDVMEANTMRVHVGVLAAKGGNAQHAGSGMTLVELAATHEFGSSDGHVPERAALRGTLYVRVAEELNHKLEAAAKLVISGAVSAEKALNLLGLWAASEVKNTITMNEADGYGEYPYPPLADSTIKAKGSSVPLIDTGQLKNAYTWVVVHE